MTVVKYGDLPPETGRGGTFQELLRDFKSKYLPSLTIMHYNSFQEAWDAGMGSEGFILTDGEDVIEELMTKMS